MLEENSYVRCLFIDYSRAFDSINHELLIRKLLSLDLSPNVVRFVTNFLTGRTQAVSLNGKISCWLSINQGIVQGSCIGPLLYITFAADLKLMSANNILFKYADDKSLMVPEKSDITLEEEFKHILHWSAQNKLTVNLTKTKEMIFHRPGPCHFVIPSSLDNVERVTCFKLLGLYITSTLSMESHVNFVLSIVSQRLFLINQLRKIGLSVKAREIVFHALIMSRLTYALPAFAGFLSCCDIARFNAVFRKAVRWGILENRFCFEEQVARAQNRLFKQIKSKPEHCLYQLLPKERKSNYQLRQRGHKYSLPNVSKVLFKKSFIVSYLYNNR
jgi:hypothetical protein